MARYPEDGDTDGRGRNRTVLAALDDFGRDVSRDVSRRRRTPGKSPSRRAATIAAVTTGTIAASTAAFAFPGADNTATLDTGVPTDAAAMTAADSQVMVDASIASLAREVAAPTPVFTDVSITTDQQTIQPNGQVVFTVRAAELGTGAPVAGQPVRVVVANGPQWQEAATLQTDANGVATISTRLLSTTTVTAVFDGTGALRPSTAGAATVTVKDPPRPTSLVSQVIPSNVPGSSYGEKAVYLASLQKGKPYVYGSTGPYSFDCSGLVQYVYRQLGKNLPRVAQSQYNATTRVPQAGKQPGDLIFFGSPGNITHVGIYAGNGYMWAAPQTGGVVSLRPIYSTTYSVGRVL
jgi:peptidoglycan DL-endopeptidase CwlO